MPLTTANGSLAPSSHTFSQAPKQQLGSTIIPSSTNGHSLLHAPVAGGELLRSRRGPPPSSRFDVIYAPVAKKQRKSWKEASLTVNAARAVLFDSTLNKTIATCGTAGASNAVFDQMMRRPGKGFHEGEEIIINGNWCVQILTVMHRHMCPYDEQDHIIAMSPPGPPSPHAPPVIASVPLSYPGTLHHNATAPSKPKLMVDEDLSPSYLIGHRPLRSNTEILRALIQSMPK